MRIAALTWRLRPPRRPPPARRSRSAPRPARVQRERLAERGRDEELRARARAAPGGPRRPRSSPSPNPWYARSTSGSTCRSVDEVADPPPQARATGPRPSGCGSAVEQDDVARATPAERVEHRRPRRSGGRSSRCRGRSGRRNPAACEQLRVVGPRGLAHPQRLATRRSGAAGPPRRAGRRCRPGSGSPAPGRDVTASWSGAQREGPDELPVRDLAVDRPVELGAGRPRRGAARPR